MTKLLVDAQRELQATTAAATGDAEAGPIRIVSVSLRRQRSYPFAGEASFPA
ncbi:TPA: hypothetical protein ACUNF5_002319 [Burkholderia orbicola]